MTKFSKQLTIRNRKKMWAFYVQDNKGFDTFEKYCSFVVKAINKLNAKK